MVTYWMTPTGAVWRRGIPGVDRPVVVIDPWDAEQIERLADIIADRDYCPGDVADDLAYAIREFANPKPPKPVEPTGLGAVVEDADGKRWVRCDKGERIWHCPDDDSGDSDDYWSGIPAVRVLSEGVQ